MAIQHIPQNYQDAYQAVMKFAIRGYTTRTIKAKASATCPVLSTIPDALITQWILESTEEVLEARIALDKFSQDHLGLAKKMERVRRLAEFAESIEHLAVTTPQWAGEYRRALSQIEKECEGTTITFNISDGWAALLRELANVGTQPQLQPVQPLKMEQGNVAPTEADYRIIRDQSEPAPVSIREGELEAKVALRRGT